MSDIALVNGDIESSFGDILTVDDDGDIVQMAINNILTIRGHNEFHPDIGNYVYSSRYKISEHDLDVVASECKNAILQDSRVKSVVSVIAKNTNNNNAGLCNISFILITEDDRQLSSEISINIY